MSTTAFSGGSVYDNGTIAANGTIAMNYSNGPIQKFTLTADSTTDAATISIPTNMNDGDMAYVIFEVLGTGGEIASWTLDTGVGWYAPTGSATYGDLYGNDVINRVIRRGSKYYWQELATDFQAIT